MLSLNEGEVAARVNEIFPSNANHETSKIFDNKSPMNLNKISDSQKHLTLSTERISTRTASTSIDEEDDVTEIISAYEKDIEKSQKMSLMKNMIPSIVKGQEHNGMTHEKLSDAKDIVHHLEDDLFYDSMRNISNDNASIETANVPETLWERKKRLHSSQLSGGGAAAAVAMVAVGSVMLILGPAVIILRALDERRQARRFLKLSGRDDLPPTYEQATLMDEAPRYSTLSLNTILGPPPPPPPSPSPTSTTAQFV